jgi:hypothetical protein
MTSSIGWIRTTTARCRAKSSASSWRIVHHRPSNNSSSEVRRRGLRASSADRSL